MSRRQHPQGRLIVELHDVAPPFEADIRAQLDALAAGGIERCVLNVVPNWHGAYTILDCPPLLEVLHEQHRAGSQLVLHGLEHRRRGALRGPAHLKARAVFFAHDAAEFLTLTPSEASESVRRGRQVFLEAGLPLPATFCAPGWLLAPELTMPLAQGGINRIVGMLGVLDPVTSRRRMMPAVGHMGASPMHEAGIQLANRLLSLASMRSRVVRLYLHPDGGVRSAAARRMLAVASHLVQEGWRPAIYDEIIPLADAV
jgi:predicted deacetylase